MSDEPLELPLFEAPEERPEDLEELFDEPQRSRDEEVVVEKIDLDAPAPEPAEDVVEPASDEGFQEPTEEIPIEPTLITTAPAVNPAAAPQASDTPPSIVEEHIAGGVDRPTPERPLPADTGSRFAAGSIDLLVHVATASLLAVGTVALGVDVGLRHLPGFAIALLAFSFVYHVVPLTFWGRTPGMAAIDLRARATGDLPLSIPQATGRFAGAALTVATLGLGALLALGDRSLADRLSGSRTFKS